MLQLPPAPNQALLKEKGGMQQRNGIPADAHARNKTANTSPAHPLNRRRKTSNRPLRTRYHMPTGYNCVFYKSETSPLAYRPGRETTGTKAYKVTNPLYTKNSSSLGCPFRAGGTTRSPKNVPKLRPATPPNDNRSQHGVVAETWSMKFRLLLCVGRQQKMKRPAPPAGVDPS